MPTKIFVRDITTPSYTGNPADGFKIEGTYLACRNAGGSEGGPENNEVVYSFGFALDASPSAVYELLYQKILDDCTANGWDIPAKTDIFAYVPVDFTTLIP